MASHRLEDHETTTPEGAAGFERYYGMPDWDEGVLASDERLERDADDPWAAYLRRTGGKA
jgi:hypothetical protein